MGLANNSIIRTIGLVDTKNLYLVLASKSEGFEFTQFSKNIYTNQIKVKFKDLLENLTGRNLGYALIFRYLYTDYNIWNRDTGVDDKLTRQIEDKIERIYFKEPANKYKLLILEHLKEIGENSGKCEFLKKELNEIDIVWMEVKLNYDFGPADRGKLRIIETIESNFFETCKEIVNQLLSKYDFSINEHSIDFPLPDFINLDEQEKFVYCHKLGIISYLKDLTSKSGGKSIQKQLYLPLSLITGINQATIKRLMSFSNNPRNRAEGNPFNNSQLMDRVNRNLINNNLNVNDLDV